MNVWYLMIFLLNSTGLIFLPRDASAEHGDATVSRPSVRNVQVPYSNTLEFFENNFTAE